MVEKLEMMVFRCCLEVFWEVRVEVVDYNKK